MICVETRDDEATMIHMLYETSKISNACDCIRKCAEKVNLTIQVGNNLDNVEEETNRCRESILQAIHRIHTH